MAPKRKQDRGSKSSRKKGRDHTEDKKAVPKGRDHPQDSGVTKRYGLVGNARHKKVDALPRKDYKRREQPAHNAQGNIQAGQSTPVRTSASDYADSAYAAAHTPDLEDTPREDASAPHGATCASA